MRNKATGFGLWYLPSWLGLDAAVVVTTWTFATGHAAGVSVDIRAASAMFFTVWAIYLADRLVDVEYCKDWSRATGRMLFGRDHRRMFLICLAGSCLAVLWLVLSGLSAVVLRRATIVGLGLAIHCFAFAKPVALRDSTYGKEFSVGVFFALGAYACLGVSVETLPLMAATAVLVAFNCLIIADRDSESDEVNDPRSASRWWSTLHRDLLFVGVALTVLLLVITLSTRLSPFWLAATATVVLLTSLHKSAKRLSGDSVRALADYALLTPLPTLCVLRWSG